MRDIQEARRILDRKVELHSSASRVDDTHLFDLAQAACWVTGAEAIASEKTQDPLLNQIAQLAGQIACTRAQELLNAEGVEPSVSAHAPHSVIAADVGAAVAASGSVPEFPCDESQAILRSTFRKMADSMIAPQAERIHREDMLVPEEFIERLGSLGCFGASIPERYGGFQAREESDLLGMVTITEELSRGSLGAAGSLVTRPEILARALLSGGTEEQKRRWLPQIASGEKMVAIAVTEPDFGSDVARIQCSARIHEGHWILNGSKTWCTFAGRAEIIGVLARTETPDSLKHQGLSLFLIEKPRALGHAFRFEIDGGTLEGRAIPTIGYRGMHSFELKFENWRLPLDSLVGGDQGRGRGFYLQMAGFEAGRLQTAARANGLMHAALEKAIGYANSRQAFGALISQHRVIARKIGQMSALLIMSRALTRQAARRIEAGSGAMEAAMAKLLASQVAEWLTREAQQIHGGMGYAEEYAVSRYFLDARVLSIFEGTEEVLALKVIAPKLLERKEKAA